MNICCKQEAERGARFLLDIGSECSVYSRSSKRWFEGYISKIFVDQHTNQEWFIVKYGNNKSKRMQRFCSDLKVKNNKTEDKQKKNNVNKEEDDNDLSDLETDETDDRISEPNEQTQNKQEYQHPTIVFGNDDDSESVNLDNLPPIKFRW